MNPIEIHGDRLTLEEIERVAAADAPALVLSDRARRAIAAAREMVDAAIREGRVVYGLNTGFGALAEVVIPPDRIEELQENLIRSHAAGVGEPLPEAEVRAIMLLRANVLALGYSGVRPEIVELLLGMLNRRVHPVVPARGSVGASGDLAPLSHIALVLMGEGEAVVAGERMPGGAALERAGLEPVRLLAKEGLALNNGTQAMTGVGALALLAAERAVETAEVAGAMSLEALRGTPDAFDDEIQRARPQPGQAESAGRLRALLRDSEIRESHRENDPRVQDAYSLRCMPQVHGAARQAFRYIRGVLEVEANSATDNPLIFPESGRILSGGNFHGQPIAQVLDLLAIACADLGAISERRLARLVDPAVSGLPAFLTPEPGTSSGFMMAQIVAASLVSELKLRAAPASTDTIPTDANKEDHVSMGMAAALKARDAVRLLETVLALEVLAAAQGLDFLRPLRPGRGAERAWTLVRERVAPLQRDRVLGPDIAAVEALVRSGALAALWQGNVDGTRPTAP
ncbi:MAG TPA: histidine ammonia-lyase [Longimicrobiales bacterium]|nr:histidine ammonia-lyase [Longimicrobiales bacterium]